ncbi:unnamed protein product, partial [marine sediment metagenome]
RHAIANLKRSLPSIKDGLKLSNRQILRGCETHWKDKIGSVQSAKMKTTNLGSQTMLESSYQYGEASLLKTISHMCLSYPGSNNIPLLFAHGQHGSRRENGKDCAAPRYTKTRPTFIFPYLFKKEDQKLLTYIDDEGKICEPEFYIPVIPVLLANGSQATATGFSTFIPSYNPIDLKSWLETRIHQMYKGRSDLVLPVLIPWFRGFKGNVYFDNKENEKKFDIDFSGFVPDIMSEIMDETTQDTETTSFLNMFPGAYDELLEQDKKDKISEQGLANIPTIDEMDPNYDPLG